jgi:hypothetical protein
MSEENPISTFALRAWRLIKDEAYQAEQQREGLQRILSTAGLDITSRVAIDRRNEQRLGAFDYPIAVNGVYGALSYLSLLRSQHGSPFAFHRLGSGLSPIGVMVDSYELISIDLRTHVRLYIDQYNQSGTKQRPTGLLLAKEHFERNPIFGVPQSVSDFPLGLTDSVRKLHISHYGFPLPVDSLREFEGLVSKNPNTLNYVRQSAYPIHSLTTDEENALSTDDLIDIRLGYSSDEYDEACDAEKRGQLAFAAERYRVALHHMRPLVSSMPADQPGAIWAPNNMIIFLLGLRKTTGLTEHTIRALKLSQELGEPSEAGKAGYGALLIALAEALAEDGYYTQSEDCITRAEELLGEL